MIKSIHLPNIWIIIKFFFESTSKSIFQSKFFKNKKNSIIFGSLVLFFYSLYFYINMLELSKLTYDVALIDADLNTLTNKVLISSFYNTVIIIGILIFVLVNSTFELNHRNYFFINSLPFTDREISISEKLFKLIISTIIFFGIFLIIGPMLSVLRINFVTTTLMFISLHFAFFSSYLFLDVLYTGTLKFFSLILKKYSRMAIDVIIIVFVLMYTLNFKFKIDSFVGQLPVSYLKIISIATIFFGLAIPITSILSFNLTKTKFHYNKKYIRLHTFKKSNTLTLITTAICRRKNFLYLFSISIIAVIFSLIAGGLNSGLETFILVYPFVGISCLLYADSTLDMRPLYKLFIISPRIEFMFLIVFYLLIMSPVLLSEFILLSRYDQFLLGFNISILATTIGFLFPKSKNNINETISSVLVIIILIVLIVISNFKNLLMIFTLISLLILYYILKKESE